MLDCGILYRHVRAGALALFADLISSQAAGALAADWENWRLGSETVAALGTKDVGMTFVAPADGTLHMAFEVRHSFSCCSCWCSCWYSCCSCSACHCAHVSALQATADRHDKQLVFTRVEVWQLASAASDPLPGYGAPIDRVTLCSQGRVIKAFGTPGPSL